jgi:patatin-like phospholipase/acyl hydrolase
MTEEKPFKILSIDGGGIKGLFSAEILSGLERQYGNTLSDYFDMICGTSTGGIIALALSIKTPMQKIVDFYKNDGPIIFPYKNTITRFYAESKQLLFNSKYSNSYLKESLNKVLAENKMHNAKNLLCIPAYNLNQGKPTVFKSPFIIDGKNLWKNDENLRMIDVALATSAAPTYFPIHSINDIYYADGGVWANNPTLCGIIEALKYFINKEFIIDGKKIKYNSIQALSISSVNQPNCWSTKRKKDRSALLWLRGNKLITPFMDGQSIYTDNLIESLVVSNNTKIEYKRIKHNDLSSEIKKNIDLDKASKSSITDLSILGRETFRYYSSTMRSEVDPYFNAFKTFKNY